MMLIRLCALGLCAVLATLTLTGCGQKYVKGTEVEYSADRQAIADVVERYRIAIEQRDTKTLRRLASLQYYENASTTTQASDDYDVNGLEKVLARMKNSVKSVKYSINIQDIEVLGETARVDYEYETQFLLAVGEQDRWDTKSDKNRLTLRKEDGEWRILGGM